jgi:hypothetical protein
MTTKEFVYVQEEITWCISILNDQPNRFILKVGFNLKILRGTYPSNYVQTTLKVFIVWE